MSRVANKMNAGRIITSPRRLQPIVEMFKRAPHPLSAQDIARHAYSHSDDIMLNVSTNIGEMRSEENRRDGYVISEAHRWVIRQPGVDYTEKACRFVIDPACALHWHDGRPRYWMISCPEWDPAWRITESGLLVLCGPAQSASSYSPHHDPPSPPETDARICPNPPCGAHVPIARIRAGYWTCSDECGEQWRQSLRPKSNVEPQESLF